MTLRAKRSWLVLALGMLAGGADAARPGAWQPLFGADDPQGWHGVGTDALPAGWRQDADGLRLLAPGAGDIVGRLRYGDFELELEWRLAAGGNSGLFYRADGRDPLWRTAVEYQLLDDATGEDRHDPRHRAGAAYDLVAPATEAWRPPPAFNRARIVACGARVEHWLNGRRVAVYTVGGTDWQKRLAASKFAATADFGAAGSGYLGIQDHGAALELRAGRIRPLLGCR